MADTWDMPVIVRVGLQLSEIDSGYSRSIVRGASELCRDRGAQLTVFSGRSPGWPYGHEYQKNAIYSHLAPRNVDALVIATGTQCNYVTPAAFADYVRGLAPLPVVSLGVPIPGFPSMCLDNESALRDLLSHMADVHAARTFTFIGGPENNPEASVRLETFRAFLRERGLPESPYRELRGDFSVEGGYRALSQCYGHHRPDCDAIVCANDNMAIGAYRYLEEIGLRPGADIAVTGFDDIVRARFESPPLTTVRQDVVLQAYRATSVALDLLEGKTVIQNPCLSAETVIRASCGCLSGTVPGLLAPTVRDRAFEERNAHLSDLRALLATYFASESPELTGFVGSLHGLISGAGCDRYDPRHWNLIINDLYREFEPAAADRAFSHRMQLAFQSARSVVAEIFYAYAGLERFRMQDGLARMQGVFSRLNGVPSLAELLTSLRRVFEELDIESAALVLFRKRLARPRDARFELPEVAEVALRYERGSKVWGERVPFDPRSEMLPQGALGGPAGATRIASALYHRQDQLGYLMIVPGARDTENLEFLCSLVSNALEATLVRDEQSGVERRLWGPRPDPRDRAPSFEEAASLDEGTGLYNRKGFVSIAGQLTDLARRLKKDCVLLLVEADGLESLGERLGADAAERALRETAVLLRDAFRDLDVVARLGPARFGVCGIDARGGAAGALERRVSGLIADRKGLSDGMKALRISVAATGISPGNEWSVEDLIAEAELNLVRRMARGGEREEGRLRNR